MRRVAIVAAGDSKFTVVEHRSEPGRTFDEVVKWTSEDAVRDVMDAALARTMHDIATDPDLVAAFARSRAASAR